MLLRLLVLIVMRYVAPVFVGVFDTTVCWYVCFITTVCWYVLTPLFVGVFDTTVVGMF